MAFVKTDHTTMKYFNLGKGEFSIYVKANSYKDGTIELNISDSDSMVNLDFELEDLSLNSIRRSAMSAINQIFIYNRFDKKSLDISKLEKLIISISEVAKKFYGRATVDYHKTDCQAMLIISNNEIHGTSNTR